MMNSNNTNTNSNGNSNSNSTNHNYGLKYITFDEFGRPSWKRPETREESRQFAKDMNKLIKSDKVIFIFIFIFISTKDHLPCKADRIRSR